MSADLRGSLLEGSTGNETVGFQGHRGFQGKDASAGLRI